MEKGRGWTQDGEEREAQQLKFYMMPHRIAPSSLKREKYPRLLVGAELATTVTK